MTPEQVDLIRKSFDALWPVRRRLADVFYSRFFELAPDARRLFPHDMERQQLKLMDMIAAIVGALDKREIFQSSSAIRVASTRNLDQAIAFRRVRRRTDLGSRTAVWPCIYSRAEASLDYALRCGAKGNDTNRANLISFSAGGGANMLNVAPVQWNAGPGQEWCKGVENPRHPWHFHRCTKRQNRRVLPPRSTCDDGLFRSEPRLFAGATFIFDAFETD